MVRLALAAAVITLWVCQPARAETPPRAAPILDLVRAKDWPAAQDAAAHYADPAVAKLVTYYRLLTPAAASLAELDGFRKANPDWPMQGVLSRRRDEALAAEPDAALAAASCEPAPPHGFPSLRRCAEAARQLGHGEVAVQMARAAWLDSTPGPAADAAFLQQWGTSIGPSEQWARFERLAWTDAAAATLASEGLQGADRTAAAAWLALRRDDKLAGEMADALEPPRAGEPGLVLEHLRWLRRASRDLEARTLWSTAGASAEREAAASHKPAFWDERNVLARRLLRAGDAIGAYALTDVTAQSAPEQRAEADFLAGWIALRRLADPAAARRHFAALAQLSTATLTRARGQYWLAQAAKAAGDAPAAATARRAAAAFIGTYYGQIASGDEATLAGEIAAARDPGWDTDRALAFSGQDLARAAAWLVAWGEPWRAQAFLLRLAETDAAPADLSLAAHFAAGLEMPDVAIMLARRAGRAGVVLLQAGWPVAAAVPEPGCLDPALALAVIRQESSFDPAATSPAGARGLMQLMPATANAVGRQLGVATPLAALTGDPALNIQLGTCYFRGILDKFAGAVPLAAAAYNAGPSRVTEWLASLGDPRAPGADMIDWIEQIPFSETRNYVQRVIENAMVYRAKLGGKPQPPLVPWPRSPA